MSESIRRRSSSRQLLQNLIRVTAQRSQEDAEEVERERRRRAREKQRGEGSPSWPEPPHPDDLTHNMESDDELKPVCCLVLDEDEGFGDWSHRLENRNESEVHDESRASRVEMTAAAAPSPPQLSPPPPLSSSSSSPPSSSSSSQKKLELKRDKEELRRNSRSHEASMRPAEKTPSHKKEVKTSYSSSVFLPQDTRQHGTGQPVERTSYLAAGTMKPRGGACRVDEEVEQVEVKEEEEQIPVQRGWRSETRQNPSDGGSDEGDQEEEELNFTCEKREDLQTSRGQRNRKEKKEEEEEAEHNVPYKTSVESSDRSSQEVDQRSAVSLCSSGSESEELLNCYGPMSPTFKKLLIQFYPDEVNSKVSPDGKCTIIERTESLRKSTSNVKKAPPVPVSKIDKKLEQYTHALELSSKEARSGAQVLTDLTGPAEPVASKKNLFEAGEAWNQNAGSVTASKDTDCLKVGVAELINQWVRGSEDGSRCCSPFKPAESSTGKKYKFVVTGHGKYEKVSVDSGCSEDDTSQSAGHFYEDL